MDSGAVANDELTQRPESPVFGSIWYPAGGQFCPTGDDAGLLDNEDRSSASPEALAATVQPPKPRGRPCLSSREVVFFTRRAPGSDFCGRTGTSLSQTLEARKFK